MTDMMKYFRYLVLSLLLMVPAAMVNAVVYLPPTEDVIFEDSEVYLHFDSVNTANMTLTRRDSVFGYIVAREVEKMRDYLDRIAIWRMLPAEVIVPEKIKDKRGVVDIYVENAPIATLTDTLAISASEIMLPYSIWCRVEVRDVMGKKIYSHNYGLLSGSKKLYLDDNSDIKQSSSIIGVMEAIATVRTDLFRRYGFEQVSGAVDEKVINGSKYAAMLKILNGNVAQFVDFYAYNDLLCQIFEFNSYFPFLRPDSIDATVKSVEASIYRRGKLHGTYTVDYKDGRLKSFSGTRHTTDSEGRPIKQKINTITPKYNKKNGEYESMSTFDSQLTKVIFPGYNNTTEWGVKSKQPNFCKTHNMIGGFIKMKEETSETVEMTIDLDGNVYFDTKISSSVPFGLFKMLADSNSVKFLPLTSENHSEFVSKVNYDENLNMVSKSLEGYILLEKNRGYKNYTFIKADSIKSFTKFRNYGKDHIPASVDRDVTVTIYDNWNIDYKWDLQTFFGRLNTKTKVNKSSDHSKNGSLTVDFSIDWDVKTTYNEKGDLVEVMIGNTDIKYTYIR